MKKRPDMTPLILLLLSWCIAGEAQDGASATPVQTPVKIPENLTPQNRDPFWPVGYVPAVEGQTTPVHVAKSSAPVSEPRWNEAKNNLRVSGYMERAKGYNAIVNNNIVSPGDVVTIDFEGKKYYWKIDSISAGSITFIPLRWETLDNKKERP